MDPSIVRTTTHDAFKRHFFTWLRQHLPGISKLFAYIKMVDFTQSLQAWCHLFLYCRVDNSIACVMYYLDSIYPYFILSHACSYNHKKLSYLFIIISGGQLKYLSTLVGLHLSNLSWGTSILGWEGGCKGIWENC